VARKDGRKSPWCSRAIRGCDRDQLDIREASGRPLKPSVRRARGWGRRPRGLLSPVMVISAVPRRAFDRFPARTIVDEHDSAFILDIDAMPKSNRLDTVVAGATYSAPVLRSLHRFAISASGIGLIACEPRCTAFTRTRKGCNASANREENLFLYHQARQVGS